MVEQLITSAVAAHGCSAEAFIHEALQAEAARPASRSLLGDGLGREGASQAESKLLRECVELAEHCATAEELAALPRCACMLNGLLPESTPPLPEPTDGWVLPPPERRGALIASMIVALLRHLSLKPQPGHEQGRLCMVMLHLQTGTRRDQNVSVWSWRLAHRIAAECTLSDSCAMRVVLCVVSRQVSHLELDGASSQSRASPGAPPGRYVSPGHEIDMRFDSLTHLAESTHSLVKLMPLSLQARED